MRVVLKNLLKLEPQVTEELWYQPAQLEVHEHIRQRKGCPHCRSGSSIVTAALPAHVQPVERCRASIPLLTNIAIAKYIDAMPLFRLEQRFKRLGYEIPRQRMCDWMSYLYEYVLVLKECIKESYLQMDETWMRVQGAGTTPSGAMKRCYLWCVCAPGKLLYVRYDPTRESKVPQELLEGYSGALGTDGYYGYNAISLKDEIIRVPCLAHIRRKFKDTQKLSPIEASKILTLFKRIYVLEKSFKKMTCDERMQARRNKQFPLFKKLYRYLVQVRNTTRLPNSKFIEAVNYALNTRYDALNYFRSGEYHLDSNAVERAIRPITVGRKNYLFFGSHDGGKWAAVFYTLFECCKIHKVNPKEWLADVLVQMKVLPKEEWDQLLPHNWQPISRG